MNESEEVYEPREDSFLLKKYVEIYSGGICLDIGTGSGIQALAASENCGFVVAVDISQKALEYCIKNIKSEKILFLKSDLFSFFKKKFIVLENGLFKGFHDKKKNETNKFDTIIFNPPYLPEDGKYPDVALDGGKKGHETIAGFLKDAGKFLAEDGKILLLFSSFTNKEKVDELTGKNNFKFTELEKKHISFEDLFVYLIERKQDGKIAEVKNIEYLAKGKRGIVSTGIYKNKKVVIKSENKDSKAIGRIRIEADFLKKLNKYSIGPKLIFFEDDSLAMEFIEGELFFDYISKNNKEEIISVIKNIFEQLYQMDLLGINKEEMHHPLKHIIVSQGMPVLIDFERCHYTEKPKNVTQFLQYISGERVLSVLKEKNIFLDKKKVMAVAKDYKENISEKNFQKIISLFD
jgi:predicted Ser/Thr protein kinase/methylase of polypeptide subunit release factors